MLATGIKTPGGYQGGRPGPDQSFKKLARTLKAVLKDVPGTASAFSERVAGGRYVTVDILRNQASRYGLNIDDVQDIVRTAIGGMNVTETVEGLERYPVNIRYPQGTRDSVAKLKDLPVVTPSGQQIPLSAVADIRVEDGPPMIKSENARLNGWIFVDIEGVDLGTYVAAARKAVSEQVELPAGYSLNWSGQYEYMERAKERLAVVVPITLVTHPSPVVPEFSQYGGGSDYHGHAAHGSDRRRMAALPARLPHVRGRRSGVHRPGGCCGRNRGRHACLSQTGPCE